MRLVELQKKINQKEALLAVIGLGYVGLPVAALLADSGFDVIGVDIQPDRIEEINHGINPIKGMEPELSELLLKVIDSRKLRATVDYNDLNDCDVILIDVETPVDEHHAPNYKALRASLKSLGAVLKAGALVIVESTIAPGTISEVVIPLLEQSSGKKLNVDFYVGNCPERVMPGKLLKNMSTLSRVCGGMTPETAETMIALYHHIVHADLDATDCITAEMVKTVENAYRDVQIGFANEVALISDAIGADVWKVRELVNKSPFRQMHLPGAGVGGHCIPKDPWLLAYSVRDKDVQLHIIPSARNVNDSMPMHMINLLRDTLIQIGCELKEARVAVLGYAYLEESDDIRNSPSEVLVSELCKLGVEVIIHDPWVEKYRGDVMERIKDCDAIVLMVAHSAYRTLDLNKVKAASRAQVLLDGRNVYNAGNAKAAGLTYRGVGKGETNK